MQSCAFNDLEGIRIAAEMEKRGGDFYKLAARVSRSQETKEILTALAEDEAVHLSEFQKLHERALAQEDVQPYAPERAAYLTALAADIAFPKGVVGVAQHLENPRAILEHAIQSEEDSIRFYSELAQDVACSQAAGVFNDIIRQEKGHLNRLQKMLSELE